MDARNESRGVRGLPNLPTEIMTEILLNLPVKSLLKFRCVSKSWLSLISSSEFIKSHLNHLKKSNNYSNHSIIFATDLPVTYYTCSLSSMLCNTVLDNAKVFDFPVSNLDYDLWYVGTCNGLLCFSVDPDALVLYNPSIRSFKTLPVSGTDTENRLSMSCGFCYDEFNDDYKVVELKKFRRTSMNDIEVKVYSLRNDSWRSIENNYRRVNFSGGAVNVGGVLHWLMYKYGTPTLIFAVNTVTHRCDTLAPPKQHDRIVAEAEWGLVELDGCLGVFYDYFDIRLDVWAMKEYGVKESWTKLFSIPYPGNLQNHLQSHLRPLFMLKSGVIFLDCGSYLMIYNSRNNSSTTRAIYTTEGGMWSVAGPMYIESLVSTSLVGE